MAEPKLIKVIMLYSSGKEVYLLGKELKKWTKANDSAASFLYVHGMKPWDGIKWKTKKYKTFGSLPKIAGIPERGGEQYENTRRVENRWAQR